MKIKKSPTKRPCSHPAIARLIASLEDAADQYDLIPILNSVKEWNWPRTDLHHWIKVLNRFDEVLATNCAAYGLTLGTPQLTEFTPKTKSLLLAILRFTLMLLEHTTNKRTFNWSDRTTDLYLTRDLDVLEATLRLALRPALTWGKTDAAAQERLLALAQGWNVKDYGLSMVDMSNQDTAIPPQLLNVKFEYYRQIPLSTPLKGLESAAAEGMHTINIGNVESSSKSIMEIYADTADTHKLPANVRLLLLHKIRIAAAFIHPQERRRLLMLRLISIAILACSGPDSSLLAKFFILEPELITQIAELVHPDRHVPIAIRTAAVNALDGLLRVRSKSSDVLSAVNVSINHGILLGIIRKMVADLSSDHSTFTVEFVDAIFTFIHSIQTDSFGGQMLINAGLIPLLIDLVKNGKSQHYSIIARTITAMDTMSYGYQTALTAFLTNRGMTVFVDRIKELVEIGSNKSPPLESDSNHTTNNSWLTLPENVLLKTLLRAASRTMSTGSTQGEGLRGLIDSSLPLSLKSIMAHRVAFGPTIYSAALLIMTTFIHNEPTSLSILQEQGLPEVFYESIEEHMDAQYDVFAAIPNVIGALCLNDSGREAFEKRNIIPKFFQAFTSEAHAKMLHEKENASLIGASIDELIRHHPFLKEKVMNSISDLLKRILELGKSYEAPIVSVGQLVTVSEQDVSHDDPMKDNEEGQSIVDASSVDVQMTESRPIDTPIDEQVATEIRRAPPDIQILKDRDKDNLILTYIDVAGRFLEGLLANQSHSREFVKTDLMNLLCQILNLPCVPADFHQTAVALSISSLFKTVGEISPGPVLSILMSQLGTALSKSQAIWDPSYGGSCRKGMRWILSPSDAEERDAANQQLRHLVFAEIMIGMVDSVFPHLAYSHSRGVVTAALKAVNCKYRVEGSTQDSNILEDLGQLHRTCMRENVELKFLYNVPSALPDQITQEQMHALSSPLDTVTPIFPLENAPKAGPSLSSPVLGSTPPNEHNLKLTRTVISQTVNACEGLFAGLIARPAPRRNPDATHRSEAVAASKIIGTIMSAHLECPFSEQHLLVDVAYATFAIKTVLLFLNKEKFCASPKASLAINFEEQDGIKRLVNLYENIFGLAEISATQSSPDDPDPPLRMLQAFGGMRIALDLLERLSNHKLLTASAGDQANQSKSNPDYVDLPAFAIRCSYRIFDPLLRSWTSDVLKHAPPNVVRLLFRCLVNILSGEGEASSDYAANAQSAMGQARLATQRLFPGSRRAANQASPANIQQLVEMGFSRNAAVGALSAVNNSLPAATEFLLMNPGYTPATVEPEGNSEEDDSQSSSVTRDQMDVDNLPAPNVDVSVAEDITNLKSALDQKRQDLRHKFCDQALNLIGTYKQLVFDLKRSGAQIFKGAEEEHTASASKYLFQPLIDRILAQPLVGIDDQAKDQLASEINLLALLMTDAAYRSIISDKTGAIVTILSKLAPTLQEGETATRWASATFLASENLFALVDAPRSAVKTSNVSSEGLLWGPELTELRDLIFKASLTALQSALSGEDLISVLRCLLQLTRRASYATRFAESANLAPVITRLLEIDNSEQSQQGQELIMLIMRHVIETYDVLKELQRSNVQEWLSKQRGRTIDIGSFLHSLKSTALRDCQLFVEICKDEVDMAYVSGDIDLPDSWTLRKKGDKLNEAQSTTKDGESDGDDIKDTKLVMDDDTVMSQVPTAPISDKARSQIGHLVHFLIHQLKDIRQNGTSWSVKVDLPTREALLQITDNATNHSDKKDVAKTAPSISPEYIRLTKQLDQTRFYIASLAELLYSYAECKTAFCEFDDSSGSFLLFVLNELIPANYLSAEKKQPSVFKSLRISEWAVLLLVALCADLTSPRSGPSDASSTIEQAKPNSALTEVRRNVIRAIKAEIEGALSSNEPTAVRYGRLQGLGDLCHNLLIPPATAQTASRRPKPPDDYYETIGRLMIEEDLASTLAVALSEVDLNFPTVKSLINRLLRPLQYLSKLVKAQGKVPTMNQISAVDIDGPFTDEDDDDSISEESDALMSGDQNAEENPAEQEAANVYRNSALGMYEGELEGQDVENNSQDSHESDEEMDEDDDDMMEMDPGLAPSDQSDQTMSDLDEDDDDLDENDMTASGSDMDPQEDDHEIDEPHGQHSHPDIEIDPLGAVLNGALGERHVELEWEDVMEDGSDPIMLPPHASIGDIPGVVSLITEEDDEDPSGEEDEMPMQQFIDQLVHPAEGDESDIRRAQRHADIIGTLEDNDNTDSGADSDPEQEAVAGFLDVGRQAGAMMAEDLDDQDEQDLLDLESDPFAHMAMHRQMNYPASHREPRPLLVAGPGQAAREMGPHPLLVDDGLRNPHSNSASSLDQHRMPFMTRRVERRTGAMDHILQTIGEQLGENAYQLFEQVLNSVQASNPHDAQQFQLVTQDGQVAASIQVPAALGGRRVRPHLHMSGPNLSHSRSHHYEPRTSLVRSSLTPTQTLLRWDQENRALQGCAALSERLAWLVGHIIDALKPSPEELQSIQNTNKSAPIVSPTNIASQGRESVTDSSLNASSAEGGQTASSNASHDSVPPIEETAQAMQDVTVSDPLAEMFALTRTLANDLAHLMPQTDDPPAALNGASPASEDQHDMVANQPNAQAVAEQTSQADTATSEHAELAVAAENTDSTTRAEASVSTSNTDHPPRQPVTISIHGRLVDITDTGIDPTFLEALPDDMREEVLGQHFREVRAASRARRPQDASETQSSTNISPEFLDALPPELRAEVLRQERAANAATSSTGEPNDMDPASFLATLDADPELRREVLLQSLQSGGADFMSTLPPQLLAEVDALRHSFGAPPSARARAPIGMRRTLWGSGASGPDVAAIKRILPTREATQLLDKSGIATIVRLLFFPQQIDRSTLQSLLLNLCDHPKSRVEIVNYLLAILQDGTRDTIAIDKTFSQMSAKASKNTPKLRKNSRPLESTPVNQKDNLASSASVHVPGENVPNLVAQRCLDALAKLVHNNESVARYFLIEQESLAGLGKKTTRKSLPPSAKGKEKASSIASVLPLSIMFGLLDREPLLSVSSIMDSLSGLLAMIARPLALLAVPPLLEKDKEVKMKESSANQPAAADSGAEMEGVEPIATPTDRTEQVQEAVAQPSEAAAIPPTADTSEDKIDGLDEKAFFEKQLRASPPTFSPQTLKLVANILNANEVSSKTFQNTLALFQYLSCLPNVLDIISSELTARAQAYAADLEPDLAELALALQNARKQSDIPTKTLSKFSSAASLQAKLLRVLKTIDFTHTHYIPGAKLTGADKTAREEHVKSIFLSFSFTGIWNELSSCLTYIEGNPDLSHVGTVLLPVIEALMVVSKCAAKPMDAEVSATQAAKALSPRTPSISLTSNPLEIAEHQFFIFTRKHRNILNVMVRNNPSLMSGSFSILVHNPAVLEFENKRNFFNQQLHKRRHTDRREHYGSLQVNVRRQYIFEDSFQSLGPVRRTPDQIKYGKLNVRFYDEEGVDAGGVTREWYSALARSIFNPGYALFQPSSSDQLVYQPNPQSYVNPDHLPFFTFVGRIIGKSVYDGRLLEAYFTKAFYKHLLGLPVDLKDLESVDPDNYRSMVWMLDNPIEGILDLTFSVEADEWGVTKIVDLKENGREIPVTDENKKEYVDLVVKHRLTDSIKEQIQAFVSGFTSIVPKELVSIFNAYELQLLISGMPDIDVDEWRANTEYQNYTSASSPIIWFWRAVRSFSQEERAKLLQFVTGSSRVPLEGFGALQGVSGNTKFTITASHKNDVLPSAHSCFNQLDLPTFSSYEDLRRMLLLAITETEGFGFA